MSYNPSTHRHLPGGQKTRHKNVVNLSQRKAIRGQIPIQSSEKRVLRTPRRNESRYTLENGSSGSRLSLKEVFNRSIAEHEGCTYKEEEPMSEADVHGINRDLRSAMYDIKGLQRGALTFTVLLSKYPNYLSDLRTTTEKKWDILQKCKAQWGVDWAIQRVLQRDRKHRRSELTTDRIHDEDMVPHEVLEPRRTARSTPRGLEKYHSPSCSTGGQGQSSPNREELGSPQDEEQRDGRPEEERALEIPESDEEQCEEDQNHPSSEMRINKSRKKDVSAPRGRCFAEQGIHEKRRGLSDDIEIDACRKGSALQLNYFNRSSPSSQSVDSYEPLNQPDEGVEKNDPKTPPAPAKNRNSKARASGRRTSNVHGRSSKQTPKVSLPVTFRAPRMRRNADKDPNISSRDELAIKTGPNRLISKKRKRAPA